MSAVLAFPLGSSNQDKNKHNKGDARFALAVATYRNEVEYKLEMWTRILSRKMFDPTDLKSERGLWEAPPCDHRAPRYAPEIESEFVELVSRLHTLVLTGKVVRGPADRGGLSVVHGGKGPL